MFEVGIMRFENGKISNLREYWMSREEEPAQDNLA